jgi:hypothetical protein
MTASTGVFGYVGSQLRVIGPITFVMQHVGWQVTWLPDEIVVRDEYKDWVFTMDWPDENGDMSQTRFFRGRRPRGSYTVRRPGTAARVDSAAGGWSCTPHPYG